MHGKHVLWIAVIKVINVIQNKPWCFHAVWKKYLEFTSNKCYLRLPFCKHKHFVSIWMDILDICSSTTTWKLVNSLIIP